MASDKDRKPGASNPALKPLNKHADIFADSVVTLDPAAKTKLRQAAAPEVSQGAWRERAYAAREQLTTEDIGAGMRKVLGVVTSWNEPAERMRLSLKTEWMPFFRQVVEQTAGDQLDLALLKRLGRPRPGATEVLDGLLAMYARLNACDSREALETEAAQIIDAFLEHLRSAAKKPVSLKAIERELEGRLDLDEVLAILTFDAEQLRSRLQHVNETIDKMRQEIRLFPAGGQPTGVLWNFTRFKAERLLLESEQKSRPA